MSMSSSTAVDSSPVPSPADSVGSSASASSEATSSSSMSTASSSSSPCPSPAEWPSMPSSAGPLRRGHHHQQRSYPPHQPRWRRHSSSRQEEEEEDSLPAPTHRSHFDEALQAAFRGAADAGDSAEVARLLRSAGAGGVDIDRYGADGRTPLLRACAAAAAEDSSADRRKSLDLVRLLVDHGADVRLRTREGWSALHVASFGGCPELVSYLIRCGRRKSSKASSS